MQYVVLFGALLTLVFTGAYALETIRGRVKPNKMTWLLWAIAPLIAAAAEWSQGGGLEVLPVFMSGFGPLLIFLSSFVNKSAHWQLRKFDFLCGGLSLLTLVIWLLTRDPNWAIFFAILSDGFAAYPTLVKMGRYPETEHIGPFASGLFSAATAFLVIKQWEFASLAFPIYLLFLDGSCTLILLFFKNFFIRKEK